MGHHATPCLASFIERAGCLCERDGLPRIAGRILGLLLVSAEPLSLDVIADRLGVSRASVSTDARRLVEQGVLERVGLPGDRKDYYRMADESPERSLEHKLTGLRQFLALLDEAQRLPDQDPGVRARLADASALYRDVMLATADALERWRARPVAEPQPQSA
jgi:biotin operon repressor